MVHIWQRLWPSARHLKEVTSLFSNDGHFKWRHFLGHLPVTSEVTSHLKIFEIFFFRENVWNCPKCQKKSEKKFQKFLVTSLQVTSLHWPSASHFSSDRHLNAVTVTSFKWRADGQSQSVVRVLNFYYLWKCVYIFRCLFKQIQKTISPKTHFRFTNIGSNISKYYINFKPQKLINWSKCNRLMHDIIFEFNTTCQAYSLVHELSSFAF